MYVDVQSKELGVGALMGRNWRMMNDVPGAAMMRMIQNDRSIAQCDFRPLVALESGKEWTLEALQADVHQTLGEQLSDIIEADQSVSETGLKVLRVTAVGSVQGVPIRWVVLHFSDDTGRRILGTFTMEGANFTSFAGSDVQLASSLRFEAQPDPTNQTTSLPRAGESTANVASTISGEDSIIEVQSASDLR